MSQDKNPGELVHQSAFKPAGHATYEDQVNGLSVIVKYGDGDLSREHAVLDAVQSDGFPKVVSYEENEETSKLVMEKLPGEGLNSIVGLDGEWRSNPIEPTRATEIVIQVADRLKTLKDAGYLYRDLNLGHILVQQKPKLKVGLIDVEASVRLDNGEARIDSETGTWETMAPEEFEVGNTMTETASVYTLGVLLAQLTTGKNPFYIKPSLAPDLDQRRAQTAFLHKQGLTFSPYEGTLLGTAIAKALNPDPSQRQQSLTDFRKELQMILSAEAGGEARLVFDSLHNAAEAKAQ